MDENLNKTPLMELISKRNSTRKFLELRVEREKIEACLEAARLAPSAENVQPWRFIVLDDPQLINSFSKSAFSGIYFPTRFAAAAPVIIVMLAKPDILANRIGRQIQDINYYYIDCGIAGQQFILRAEELGLGSCWIGWFHTKNVRNILNIPKKYKIVSLIALGYPKPIKLKAKRRKSLKQIHQYNECRFKD